MGIKKQYRAVIQISTPETHFEVECIEPTKEFCLKKSKMIISALSIGQPFNVQCEDIMGITWKQKAKAELQKVQQKITDLGAIVISSRSIKLPAGKRSSLRWHRHRAKELHALIAKYKDITE